jgi:hypothetical protein
MTRQAIADRLNADGVPRSGAGWQVVSLERWLATGAGLRARRPGSPRDRAANADDRNGGNGASLTETRAALHALTRNARGWARKAHTPCTPGSSRASLTYSWSQVGSLNDQKLLWSPVANSEVSALGYYSAVD